MAKQNSEKKIRNSMESLMVLLRCVLRGNLFPQAILMAVVRHRSKVLGNRNRMDPLVAFDVD